MILQNYCTLLYIVNSIVDQLQITGQHHLLLREERGPDSKFTYNWLSDEGTSVCQSESRYTNVLENNNDNNFLNHSYVLLFF